MINDQSRNGFETLLVTRCGMSLFHV